MIHKYDKELAEKNREIWEKLLDSDYYYEYLDDLCKKIKILLVEAGLNSKWSFATIQSVAALFKAKEFRL